jgi:hypothetical protein
VLIWCGSAKSPKLDLYDITETDRQNIVPIVGAVSILGTRYGSI